jgi:hypothetical protein
MFSLGRMPGFGEIGESSEDGMIGHRLTDRDCWLMWRR